MKWLVPLALAACATPPGDDVVYTGPVHRFAVDAFELPRTTTEARNLAVDLDGDQRPENLLGQVIATLASQGNITTHGHEMIASGAIASVVEIQADDLHADDTVAVRYLGGSGSDAAIARGDFIDGVFASRRIGQTSSPGTAIVHLPVFLDASPSVVTFDLLQIDLAPDGAGGYHALLSGALRPDPVKDEAARGLIEMVRADPAAHPYAIEFLDRNRDGTLTADEVKTSDLVVSLLAPDLQLALDGERTSLLSFAFRAHLQPCADGRCAPPPVELCHDGVRDGAETEVDCGGGCRPCPGGVACAAASDCQSQTCGATGTCAEATCSDGVRDGFETDVDCGWHCARCQRGRHCERDSDCASGTCGLGDVCA